MASNFVVKDGSGAALTKSSTDVGSGVQADRVQVCDATAANFLPSGDAAARSIYVIVNNGTQTMPSGDAAAREIFVGLADGTTGPAAVKAASTGAAATDKALVVRPLMGTDGTNTMPTADAVARSMFSQITDATTGPVAVKAASTGAAATDKALVVRPMMGTNGTQTMPTGDAAARTIYVTPNDGTNAVTVKGASDAALDTDTALVTRPMMGTDGTNTMPTGDAIARSLFTEVSDGTTGPVAVKAASTGAAATDKALVVRPMMGTDGTNTMPTGDAIARSVFTEVSDGTTGPVAVKAASTGAALVDKALVVAISPNCGLTKGGAVDLDDTVVAVKATAGVLRTLTVVNAQAALIAIVQLFDVAAVGVTLGTTVPDLQIAVPAQTTVHIPFPDGLPFGTAISIASTTTVAGATGSAAGVNAYWSRA